MEPTDINFEKYGITSSFNPQEPMSMNSYDDSLLKEYGFESEYREGESPATPKQQQHPEVSNWLRAKTMNLTAGSPAVAKRYLEQNRFDVVHRGGYNFSLRHKDDPQGQWYVLDPEGVTGVGEFFKDITDVGGDIVTGTGAAVGATVSSPSIIGTAAGGAAGAVAAQGLLNVAGVAAGVPLEGSEGIKREAILGGLTGGAVKGLEKGMTFLKHTMPGRPITTAVAKGTSRVGRMLETPERALNKLVSLLGGPFTKYGKEALKTKKNDIVSAIDGLVKIGADVGIDDATLNSLKQSRTMIREGYLTTPSEINEIVDLAKQTAVKIGQKAQKVTEQTVGGVTFPVWEFSASTQTGAGAQSVRADRLLKPVSDPLSQGGGIFGAATRQGGAAAGFVVGGVPGAIGAKIPGIVGRVLQDVANVDNLLKNYPGLSAVAKQQLMNLKSIYQSRGKVAYNAAVYSLLNSPSFRRELPKLEDMLAPNAPTRADKRKRYKQHQSANEGELPGAVWDRTGSR